MSAALDSVFFLLSSIEAAESHILLISKAWLVIKRDYYVSNKNVANAPSNIFLFVDIDLNAVRVNFVNIGEEPIVILIQYDR